MLGGVIQFAELYKVYNAKQTHLYMYCTGTPVVSQSLSPLLRSIRIYGVLRVASTGTWELGSTRNLGTNTRRPPRPRTAVNSLTSSFPPAWSPPSGFGVLYFGALFADAKVQEHTWGTTPDFSAISIQNREWTPRKTFRRPSQVRLVRCTPRCIGKRPTSPSTPQRLRTIASIIWQQRSGQWVRPSR